jgi:hypothetical protein
MEIEEIVSLNRPWWMESRETESRREGDDTSRLSNSRPTGMETDQNGQCHEVADGA